MALQWSAGEDGLERPSTCLAMSRVQAWVSALQALSNWIPLLVVLVKTETVGTIDLFTCKNVVFDFLHVRVDSCHVLGSDHDMVSAVFFTDGCKAVLGSSWSGRTPSTGRWWDHCLVSIRWTSRCWVILLGISRLLPWGPSTRMQRRSLPCLRWRVGPGVRRTGSVQCRAGLGA